MVCYVEECLLNWVLLYGTVGEELKFIDHLNYMMQNVPVKAMACETSSIKLFLIGIITSQYGLSADEV